MTTMADEQQPLVPPPEQQVHSSSSIISDSLTAAGFKFNTHGGAYRSGKSKSLEDKATVARLYLSMKEKNDGKTSIRQLAKEAKISRPFAQKVITEVENGKLIDPKSQIHKKGPRGIGVKSFTERDIQLLRSMHAENSNRTHEEYRKALLDATGTQVSTATICRWFLENEKGGGKGVVSPKKRSRSAETRKKPVPVPNPPQQPILAREGSNDSNTATAGIWESNQFSYDSNITSLPRFCFNINHGI